MNLTDLYKQSEYYTDEAVTTAFALSYANKAISYLNTELGLTLPIFGDVTTDYTVLPDSWLMRLILPYIAYGIKMKDTSLTEAARYEEEFFVALASFRDKYYDIVDAEYISEDSSNIWQSSARNVNPGWFHGGW